MCETHCGFGGIPFCGGKGRMIDLEVAEDINQGFDQNCCLACWSALFVWQQLSWSGIYRTGAAN
jgi:hypothetical protein